MLEQNNRLERRIFFVLVILFITLVLISWIYGFIKKPEPSEFSFETCVEKYIFVYEDLCDENESFYITYPEMEVIDGQLDKIYLDDYTYTVFFARCIQYYKTGCMENNKNIG